MSINFPKAPQIVKIVFLDMDGTQVPSITAHMRRRIEIAHEMYSHPESLRHLGRKKRKLFETDPKRFFIERIRRAEQDWRRTAARLGKDVWDVSITPYTDFMRQHFLDASEHVGNDFLAKHPDNVACRPFEGMPEVADHFRGQGALVAILTDAEPVHARRMAKESGMFKHVDAIIGRDYFCNPDQAKGITLSPLNESDPDMPPHYVVGNMKHGLYPKYLPELYDMLARLFGVGKNDMALIDDHPDICDMAKKSGIHAYLAHFDQCDGLTMEGFLAFSQWTSYFDAYYKLYAGLRRNDESLLKQYKAVAEPVEIVQRLIGVPGALMSHIHTGTVVNLSRCKIKLFTPPAPSGCP